MPLPQTRPAAAPRSRPPARGGLALLAAALVLAPPALADDRRERAAALIEAAVAEHRVFQTCAALLPDAGSIAGLWDRLATDSIAILQAQAGTWSLVARLRATLEPGALVLPDETPFGQVRAFCAADPPWNVRLNTFSFLQLDRDLQALYR